MSTRQKVRSKKLEILVFLVVIPTIFCFLMLLSVRATAQTWPARSITVYVGASAGGIADTSTRVFVNEVSKTLGQPIAVLNVPGASGGLAVANTFNAPNDGYVWVSTGAPLRTVGIRGVHKSGPKDLYYQPTVAYTGAFVVRMDSPYKTFSDLVEAMKKNPGKITYGGSTGDLWRISVEVMGKGSGLKLHFVPYPGASAALVGLLTGDVNFVMCGIGEQAELLKGKKARALAHFDTEPFLLKGYGEIPAITDFLPELKSYLPLKGFITTALRADTPIPILRKIDEAMLKASKSDSVKEYCERFEVSPMRIVGEKAQEMVWHQAKIENWMLYELGVAKISPEQFNIPKP